MSSHAPSEGTFFVDQQPVAVAPAPAPAPPPAAPVAPAAEAPAPPVEPAPLPTPNAMRDVPLGTLIFRAGLLAEEQLEDALQEGMRTGKRLGEVLAERGLIQDSELGRLLAGQQDLSFVEVTAISVDPAARQLLPENIARMQNALAFAVEDGTPVVAVADPTNELVIENVKRALGMEPRLVVAAHGDLARKIEETYSAAAAQPVAPPAAEPAVVPPAPVEQAAPAEQAAPLEQPQPAPAAPAPMPTVVPPPEERVAEPQQPVAAAAPAHPAEVPPLHAEAAAAPPLAPEPVAPAAVAPAAPVSPEPVPAPPVAEEPPAPAPAPAAEQPPAPAPVPAPAPAAEQPPAPGLFTQAAEQALAPPVDPQPAAPAVEPPPVAAPAAPPQPEVAPEPTHFVALRLTDAEQLEIGGFAGREEAESFARTVVGRITRAEEQAEWPFFAERFLRPQTILSVDVVEQSGANWAGSPMRTRWANPSGA